MSYTEEFNAHVQYNDWKGTITAAGPISCAMDTACLVVAGYAAAAAAPTGIGSLVLLAADAIICVCGYCEGGCLTWFW